MSNKHNKSQGIYRYDIGSPASLYNSVPHNHYQYIHSEYEES